MRGGCGCLGCLFRLIVLPILIGAVMYCVIAVLDPWALHMGGRATPTLTWQGVGTLKAKDGRAYPLYVFFFPSTGASKLHRNGLRPTSGLSGTATLCTAPGQSQTLRLSGMMWGGYTTTEGSLVSFRLFEWKIFDPQMRNGYFDLMGGWQGGALVMDRPGEAGHVFLSGPQIEGATAAFHYGTKDEFDAACRAMGNSPAQ